ncbi:MAG: tRNA 4-thiouridine(8) synthase ThiI [Anaeromicrobium sp.]|jgi:thiamine biosynthesis protein ThiI|uniref:tRNA uracil 4-sulfurtransferase ThiI n=1 Tax=Anaeromicrobium sp. TaxID=1929132 RepID=UPI0025E1098F|nr:tRNA uracil 4-sulfurtransferase ThiI [Anaeromicrobium sp.]MCT4593984.1 tRNA 4-thiouridine(8) synthase ThiI [Anaeromicrobium sp.]
MKRELIIRYGEIILKGLNRPYFENKLIRHIKNNLKDLGNLKVKKANGLLILDMEDYDEDEVIERVRKVFGVASISLAYVSEEKNMDSICECALKFLKDKFGDHGARTFKVEAKRADKSFKIKSPEIAREVGAYVLKNTENYTVDVHNPEVVLRVDVRHKIYAHSEKISGYGGLPLGTNGKGLLLLSGGIDSPVAGWMMAKRGVEIEGIHYHSYPFTSDRAKEKVIELARKLSIYCGTIKLHSINLLPIQKEINEKCPEDEMTILSRRFMMKIAEKIANKQECNALITGENIGQVASQTIQGLTVTNSSVNIPVFRPLIAMDKIDIIKMARTIDTYETSILPFEDCCTVFLPKRPVTKPRVDRIEKSEGNLDVDKLIDEAIGNMETIEVNLED